MKKLLFFLVAFGIAGRAYAMDHGQQMSTYLQTQEWRKLINYMVKNNLSAQDLIAIEPRDLDLGYGKNRLLVKFVYYITTGTSRTITADQQRVATGILKSLIDANKFDLTNQDGFEGDLGAAQQRFLKGLCKKTQEPEVSDPKKRIYTLKILTVVGVACIAAAGLYVWYIKTYKAQEDDEDEESSTEGQSEEKSQEHADTPQQNAVAV